MGDEHDELIRRLREFHADETRHMACLAEAVEVIEDQRQTIAELRRIAARAVVHEAACTYTYYAYTRDCDCGAIEDAIRKEQTP